MHPADKTEVCDVQFVAAINDKVRHFIRKYAGTGAIDIMPGEELSNVCECLQRFLTYAPGQVILMQADFPTSQDQVSRRQGTTLLATIYDLNRSTRPCSQSSILNPQTPQTRNPEPQLR